MARKHPEVEEIKRFVQSEFRRWQELRQTRGDEYYLRIIGEAFVDGIVTFLSGDDDRIKYEGQEFIQQVFNCLDSFGTDESPLGPWSISSGMRKALAEKGFFFQRDPQITEDLDIVWREVKVDASCLCDGLINRLNANSPDRESRVMYYLIKLLSNDDRLTNAFTKGVVRGLDARNLL